MMNLTKEQKEQFSEIIDELGKSLDITEAEFNAAVSSYKMVGEWLCKDDSLLKPFNPEIKPQGSLIIGTAVRPVDPKLDMDLDIVCELEDKAPTWVQKNLKDIVGDQIKKHKGLENICDEEKRRCWTLLYRQNSDSQRYHMDILPSVSAYDWDRKLQLSLSDITNMDNVEDLAIRITDNQLPNYTTARNISEWYLSNPFGYAKWFMNKAVQVRGLRETKMFSLNEAVQPMPSYQTNKYPLQRVVQILKRHRDMMFSDDEERPISVIITTLAAHAYQGEANVLDALVNVVNRMHLYVEDKIDFKTLKTYKFIGNPVLKNQEENFADKWIECPAKQAKFYQWLEKVKQDIAGASTSRGTAIQESLIKSFGEREVKEAFNNIGSKRRLLTEQGKTRFDTKLGIMSAGATIVKPHTFYGAED